VGFRRWFFVFVFVFVFVLGGEGRGLKGEDGWMGGRELNVMNVMNEMFLDPFLLLVCLFALCWVVG
jgi:hypothetical protein